MKLAEALLQRSDMREKLNQIEYRITMNSKVQEDMEPGEDPNKLIKEFIETNSQMTALVQRINKTNQYTMLNDDQSLSDAIVLRESLKRQYSSLLSIQAQASEKDYRLTRTEIKMTLALDLKNTQKLIDNLAKEIRLVDSSIQEKNWLTELI